MSPMPDIDPEEIAKDAPPPCSRYPTCEGYLDDPTHPYPGNCTWPNCAEDTA